MSKHEEEESPAVVISPEVIYQQDKAAIDMQISTAKAYPRNIKKSTENAIAVATMDRETASTCTYSVPRGGKSITGPSVHLARIIAQQWGNMRIESKVISIDEKTVTSQAIAFDLESNLAIKMEVKRSIMTKNGRMNDDMIVVTGNAGNSIAFRNAVLSVIPKAVVDKVYNAAKEVITGDVSDKTKLITRRKQVVDGLMQTYGVTEKEVLTAIGKAAVEHITADDLVVLIGIGQGIKDGDTTIEQAFKGKPSGPTPSVEVSKEEISRLLTEAKPLVEAIKSEDELNALVEKYKELTNNQDFKTLVGNKRNQIKKNPPSTLL